MYSYQHVFTPAEREYRRKNWITGTFVVLFFLVGPLIAAVIALTVNPKVGTGDGGQYRDTQLCGRSSTVC